MAIIYEPKGKAREYCELAINLYRGCEHGCSYCYAPNILYLSRDNFKNASIRQGILKQIEKEAPAYANSGKEVQLCFTCDPYHQLDAQARLTRDTINILHNNNITVRILTKGGKRSERDFDLLSANKGLSWYGATLTFTEDKDSLLYEPMAALPIERFESLKKAHQLGIKTWASLEPVIIPEQTLQIIEHTHKYIDVFKVGKWNHSKDAAKIDWQKFTNEAVEILKRYNKQYYIKQDLQKFLLDI